MTRNGSPSPIFETDKDKTYFLTILPVHPEFAKAQKENGQVGTSRDKSGISEGQVGDKAFLILKRCIKPKRRGEILQMLDLVNKYENYERYILPLIEKKLLAMTNPEKPRSSKQKYFTTENGKEFLK